MIHFDGIESLRAAAGEHLGYSEWHEITQEQVNQFAAATGDRQWIHVDPERAKREGPFGGTIAHGYLTLALVSTCFAEIYSIDNISMGLNYGCNRLRFPAPVPVGGKVRMSLGLTSVEDIPGGVQVLMNMVYEVADQVKPGCVADAIFRFYR